MSGDSFKPEEGGEIQVVNPDAGNTEIEAQPEPGDAMDAAELEALKEFEETSEVDEATEEEVEEPDPVTEDLQAGEDEAESEPEAEDAPEEPQAVQWDGNPETLPEPLQPAYKAMLKGFHQKTRELADMRRETQELNAKLLLKLDGSPDSQPQAEGPPSLPTGENVTAEQWEAALDARQQYWADKALQERIAKGELVTKDQYQPIEQQAHKQEILYRIASIPGFDADVEQRMVEMADEDTTGFWAKHITEANEEGMAQLALLAIKDTQAKRAATAAATKKAEGIKKKAKAAQQATPRLSTPASAAPEDVFAKKAFMTEDEKMAEAERLAVEGYGD